MDDSNSIRYHIDRFKDSHIDTKIGTIKIGFKDSHIYIYTKMHTPRIIMCAVYRG